MRETCFLLLILITLVSAAAAPGSAAGGAEEATRESCEVAVAEARQLAAALAEDDPSRYFAERDLHQALVEAGNGEFDDCLDATARATEELRERRHRLKPGERLQVLQPSELPPH